MNADQLLLRADRANESWALVAHTLAERENERIVEQASVLGWKISLENCSPLSGRMQLSAINLACGLDGLKLHRWCEQMADSYKLGRLSMINKAVVADLEDKLMDRGTTTRTGYRVRNLLQRFDEYNNAVRSVQSLEKRNGVEGCKMYRKDSSEFGCVFMPKEYVSTAMAKWEVGYQGHEWAETHTKLNPLAYKWQLFKLVGEYDLIDEDVRCIDNYIVANQMTVVSPKLSRWHSNLTSLKVREEAEVA